MQNDYNAPFPKRLRELMEQQKVKQKAVADALQVQRQSVAQYCDGSAMPTAQRLCALADFLNVTTDYLLGRTICSTPNIEMQAACARFGLSEKALSNLVYANTPMEAETQGTKFYIDNAGFVRLIDRMICEMSMTDVDRWYQALLALEGEENDAIRVGDTDTIDVRDAKALYAHLIASHVQDILMKGRTEHA